MASTQSRSSTSLEVTIVFLVVSSAFVALRFISRIGIVKNFQLDDYFMVAAWIVSFGLSFSVCYGTTVGLGRHEVDIPPQWNAPLKKTEYAFSVLYNPALMLTKTSILVFFLRLSTAQKIFRWACWATLLVVNIGGLALTILNVVQCRPLSAAFKTPIPADAHCIDITTLYLASAPLNIITDLALLILPFPILTSIKLPKKQKIILLITFGFGIFVAAVDVVRIAYLQDAFTNRIKRVQAHRDEAGADSRNDSDFSWYAAISYTFSAIEVDVGIMVACVPALKPLVSRFMPSMIKGTGDEDFTLSPSRSAGATQTRQEQRARSDSSAESSPSRSGNATENPSDGQLGMMDFLTTPDMTELPEELRPRRAGTTLTFASQHTAHTAHNKQSFFDFVDQQQKKSIVHMSTREAIYPFVMVTAMFFVWGFAYGLLDSLNSQFQKAAHMTSWQTVGIHSAYFGGYLFGPLTFGRLVLKYWGFRACYVVGLAIYSCGTFVFWPAAVLTSFGAFLVSNFLVALGLSTLEISANPFISLCGPPEWMELRLNLSQGVQAIATVVAPLLAEKVLFKGTDNVESLIDVQWTYLGIGFFTVLLALAYYYVPLPEVTDAELEELADRPDGANRAEATVPLTKGLRTVRYTTLTLAAGIFSLWCYVAGQEGVSTGFGQYLTQTAPRLDIVNHQAGGHAAFAVSRFLVAWLNLWIKPRHLLLASYGGAILFAALCMANLGEASAAAFVIVVYFFEGPLFGLIFAMSIRGLGRRTKDASAGLTAAISGGAVLPPIMRAVANGHGERYAFCCVVAAFSAGALMVVWVTGVAPVRLIVDPVKTPPAVEERDDEGDSTGSARGGSRQQLRKRVLGSLRSSGRWTRRRRREEEGTPEKRSETAGSGGSDEQPEQQEQQHQEKKL